MLSVKCSSEFECLQSLQHTQQQSVSATNKIYKNVDADAQRVSQQFDVCPVRNTALEDLNEHAQNAHDDGKPYNCTVCNARFAHGNSYYKHMRNVHVSVKAHMCDTCGKRFAAKQYLKRHKMTHLADRPYACPICCKTYASHTTLNIHVRSHTGDKPYICTMCGKKFAASKYLRLHQVTYIQAFNMWMISKIGVHIGIYRVTDKITNTNVTVMLTMFSNIMTKKNFITIIVTKKMLTFSITELEQHLWQATKT